MKKVISGKLLSENQSNPIGTMSAPAMPTGSRASGGALPPARMALSRTLRMKNHWHAVPIVMPSAIGMKQRPHVCRSLSY